MQRKELIAAVAEANRFLSRARSALAGGSVERVAAGFIDDTVRTAAVRRASMDLTRALAALRKS